MNRICDTSEEQDVFTNGWEFAMQKISDGPSAPPGGGPRKQHNLHAEVESCISDLFSEDERDIGWEGALAAFQEAGLK